MIALAAILRGRRQRGALRDAADHARRWRRRRCASPAMAWQGPASSHPALVVLFYLIPLLGAGLALVVLMGYSPGAILARRRAMEAAGMSWSWTLYRYLAVQFLAGRGRGLCRIPGAGLLHRHRRSAQPHRRPRCRHRGRDRHGGAAAARSRPEDAALRHSAGRRLHLRAAVAQPGTGGDARRGRVGLGFPAAAAGGGGR